jgi:hypothetical protein
LRYGGRLSIVFYDNDRYSLEVFMAAPTLSGLHHVTFPVSDFPVGISNRSSRLREDIAQAKARGALNLGIGSRAIAAGAAHLHLINALTKGKHQR